MRLLLIDVLILGLLAGDAAASTGAASLGVCDAANLAGEVAATCAAGVPTPACCEPLVASVDLGAGGDCLCSVAHETPVLHAGLNSSILVALHSACGGALAVVSACHGTIGDAFPPPSLGSVEILSALYGFSSSWVLTLDNVRFGCSCGTTLRRRPHGALLSCGSARPPLGW